MSGNPAKPVSARLLSVAEARAAMLATAAPLAAETVPLEQALGRILADAVIAGRDQPPFAVSAMDGYAVRSADTPGNLRLGGESAAGHGFEGLCQPGMAIRISTGAAIPDGADSVVIQEEVERQGDAITVPAAKPGANLRPRGGDFAAGAILLPAGRRLDGVALSLVAASGAAQVKVIRSPRITILSSGDELAAPGTAPGKFQIFDSVTFGIAGLVRAWGGTAQRLAVEKDDAGAIARAAEKGLRDSDLLLVLGGASVGDHDHARPALMRLGLELLVGKIAVRPGKPTWFGKVQQGLVLGLPGNPASALACARLFLRPLIDKMLGCDPQTGTALHRARLKQALPANGPREHYLRALLEVDQEGQQWVRAHEDQDSSLISVFASANALIRQPADCPALNAGTPVDILPLEGA
ncbi:MAG TPA: gephyrin-like molybdotransferase Glp [Rhizomicrobium sp.]|nr:gephyrin-like molybdotransferase Glp [Rhizomicrobium sp.]